MLETATIRRGRQCALCRVTAVFFALSSVFDARNRKFLSSGYERQELGFSGPVHRFGGGDISSRCVSTKRQCAPRTDMLRDVQFIYQGDVEVHGQTIHVEGPCFKWGHDCECTMDYGLRIQGSTIVNTDQRAGGRGQDPVIQASCLANRGPG